MEIQFKFNIGDIVTHKTMAPPYLVASDKLGDPRPQLFMIMGRLYDECPGGIQKHYRVRITAFERWGGSAGITDKMFQLHEEELVPYEAAQRSTNG